MLICHSRALVGAVRPRPKRTARGNARVVFALAALVVAFLSLVPRTEAESVEQVAAQAKNGYVTDLAGVLSQGAKDQLTALCTELNQKAQAQVAVVTIKSLDGQDRAQYGTDLGQRLGVGPKGQDRGVLILFAIADHQYYTAVGYGLEPILPDGKVGGFGREAVPYLRQGNYDGAILLVTWRIADVIAADRGVTLSGSAPRAPIEERNVTHITAGEIFVLVVFAIFIIRLISRASAAGGRPGRGGGGGWWIGPMIGGGFGGGGFGGGGGGGGGGFGGFGGGSFGGGGAGGSW